MRSDKEKPAPQWCARGRLKLDHTASLIHALHIQPCRKSQPIAKFRPFGVIGIGIYVREGKTETRVGLAADTGEASGIVADLNAVFAEEM